MMVGRELTDMFPKKAASHGEEVLGVRRISLRRSDRPGDYLVRDVTFHVRRGEIVGIFGLMGAGRTELLQSIFGLHPDASSGEIRVDNMLVSIRSPQDAIAAGIAFAPEDRKAEGLVLAMSVAENTSLPCLQPLTRFGLLRPAREQKLVAQYVDRLAVKTPSLKQKVRNLSGGNQQKVVLAKWLATKPKVLLLDEPTRGIDINAKRELYALINEQAEGGLGIVLVSSELPEVLAVADRCLVMADGQLAGEFGRGEASEEDIMNAALPAGKTRS
jgi:ribose transport system ATP-binding protein